MNPTVSAPPSVIIVDDDPSVRKSLARLVRVHGYAAQTFASAAEFLKTACPEGPSCLVLDVRMPGMDGIELQAALCARADNDLPIIFITGHGDIPMSVKAMKAGAVDFLPKPFEATALLSALQKAIERSRDSLDRRAHCSQIQSRLQTLTPRERDVFRLVVTGMLNKQIAGELNISEKTVKIHRARVMRKSQARSLAELVLLAQPSHRD